MAAWVSSSERDFFCPVCHDLFKNPVVLSCSHSFCKHCLLTWWAETPTRECPLCKRRSSKSDPPCNLVLKNLCKSFMQELSLKEKASGALCSLHTETMKLFCLEHQKPVCVVCRDSKAHTNHKFRPVDEAAEDYRAVVRNNLKPLQDKLEHLNQAKVTWDQTAQHIKVQAQYTERQIKDEFKKLHQFLLREEELRITALVDEEEQKSQMMNQRIDALSKDIAALSGTIDAAEKELRAADVSFLQNYKATWKRVQQCLVPNDPQPVSGALIDVAKHLGNLTFSVWNKMKDMVTYCPVILDPNTANPNLVLSKDLMSVSYTAEGGQQLPGNPERFQDYLTVLGSEGFSSGSHSWDVEIRNSANWAVGVLAESVPRMGEILIPGYWEIWFDEGKYRAFSPSHTDKVLSPRSPFQRIRVHLDMGRGKLSFFDLNANANIYTFSQTFTSKVFPFLNTQTTMPLRISPVKVTAQPEL